MGIAHDIRRPEQYLDSAGIHAGSSQTGRLELTSGRFGPATVAHPRMPQKLNLSYKNVKNSLLDGGSSEFWMRGWGVSGPGQGAEG